MLILILRAFTLFLPLRSNNKVFEFKVVTENTGHRQLSAGQGMQQIADPSGLLATIRECSGMFENVRVTSLIAMYL